jgi:gamma-glutamyltranspeptidase/glutathione hydrolase
MQNIKRFTRFYLAFILVIAVGCASTPRTASTSPASGSQGVVVASHPIAAEVGLNVLKSGGNAVDAAVAVGLALGVVDQFNSGVGGGGFIVIRMADGSVYTIDGRETAPAAASRDMYIRGGGFDPRLSKVGPLAVGVPGIVAAYDKALELAGTKPLDELLSPSIKVAENGFELDDYYISRYSDAIEELAKDSVSARIYLHPDGSSLQPGDILKQPDLASTYRKLADKGLDYFYRGEFAQVLSDYMNESGGLIAFGDMVDYAAIVRRPIIGTYRDYQIIGMGPPSSGGVHTVQILNMLEVNDLLAEQSGWDMDSIYWTSRYMRRAFEDRSIYLGDSDFYDVPIECLTSKKYAEACVNAAVTCEQLPLAQKEGVALPKSHTTNLCVIDKWGNAVAINQTVNLTYGAKITLPGTGVILNNEMDDFSAQPGMPNAFGLIGSEANSIAPGKRPLSSMSPTIVMKDNKPVMILGGAGGPTIITGVLQVIVNIVDFGDELPQALARPRFHHQFRPDAIIMESGMSNWTRAGLTVLKRQPQVVREPLGKINAIAWSEEEQAYIGLPDPRLKGGAAAY